MGLPMSSLILLLFVLWGQDSAADRRLSTVEGESDYCCRPHNTHNSRIRLDIDKGCLHMDRWMCQYSFRGLTVHTDISPSVIYCALIATTPTLRLSSWILLALQTSHELDLLAATPNKLYAYMAKGSRKMSVVRAAQELRERGRGGGVRAGYREVTATEALYRLDPSLSFTSSTFGQVVR